MPLQLYCAWLEGSQQLHNALQQRKHGLSPQCPAASPFPIQVLGKTSSFAEDEHSVKQGVDTVAERVGLGVRDKSKEKPSSCMMAIRNKHASDL